MGRTFIIIDSADDGTRAAPASLIDYMGLSLNESLPLVADRQSGRGLAYTHESLRAESSRILIKLPRRCALAPIWWYLLVVLCWRWMRPSAELLQEHLPAGIIPATRDCSDLRCVRQGRASSALRPDAYEKGGRPLLILSGLLGVLAAPKALSPNHARRHVDTA